MDSEEAPCQRCGEQGIAYDPGGACYVCQSCGFVPREQGFVSYDDTAAIHGEDQPQYRGGAGSGGAQGGIAGAYAAAAGGSIRGDGGGGGGLPPGTHATRLAAAARSAADPSGAARQRRQRSQIDELGSLAATLRLPGPVQQLAAGFLARLHAGATAEPPPGAPHAGQAGAAAEGAASPSPGAADGRSSGGGDGCALLRAPTTGGSQSSARLGALLYLASRCEGGSLTLAEVAAATATDMFRVGELARQQAAYLRLALPAVDVERFVMRTAMELAAGAAVGGGAGPAAAGVAGVGFNGVGAADAAAVAAPSPSPSPCSGGGGVLPSEVSLRRHPLVVLAARLTSLAVRRGWHEGRTPRTVAGALLSICLDALQAPGGGGEGAAGGEPGPHLPLPGPLSTPELAQLAMCAPSALNEYKQEIRRQLLSLASGLPFGCLLGPHNVASYLGLILEAEQLLGLRG